MTDGIRGSLAKTVIAGAIGVALVYALFPILWTFLLSFKTLNEALSSRPQVLFHPTFSNYSDVAGTLAPYALNSIIVLIGTLVLSLVIGTLGAYAFSQFRFRGNSALMFSVLSTMFLPPIVVAIPLYYLAIRTGLLGSLTVIILVEGMFNAPFVIWMMKSFFDDIPVSLHEAAQLDGASEFRTFAAVFLPLARPGVVVAGILTAFYSWSEFLFTNILSTSGTRTLPVYISGFQTSVTQTQWGQLGAAVTLGILPVLVGTLAVQRFLVRGLTFGAVKG
jgi:multiple sugar transport system permease protein